MPSDSHSMAGASAAQRPTSLVCTGFAKASARSSAPWSSSSAANAGPAASASPPGTKWPASAGARPVSTRRLTAPRSRRTYAESSGHPAKADKMRQHGPPASTSKAARASSPAYRGEPSSAHPLPWRRISRATAPRASFIAPMQPRAPRRRATVHAHLRAAPRQRPSPSSRDANRDAGVVEEEAVVVVREPALVRERRSAVVVALPVGAGVHACVALVEPLDRQIEGADIRRRNVGVLPELEPEAMNREGVRERRRFEIHIQASVEMRCGGTVDPPAAGAVRIESQLVAAQSGATLEPSAPGRPIGRELDHVPDRPRLTVFDGAGGPFDAVAVLVPVHERHLEAVACLVVSPGRGARRAMEADICSGSAQTPAVFRGPGAHPLFPPTRAP